MKLYPPYSNDWRKAYLITNSEKRKTVILFNSSSDRSSTSFARYLMSVKLGRYLLPTEQVDHIDNDKTNDSVENLQILSQVDNLRKSIGESKLISLTCDFCSVVFLRPASKIRMSSKTTCCSRSCSVQLRFYR